MHKWIEKYLLTYVYTFKDSLKIAQNRYGSNHEVVASVMNGIGSIHDCKGYYQEAIVSCYKHSVRVYGRVSDSLDYVVFDKVNRVDENEYIRSNKKSETLDWITK
jgi:hypothetical protein